MNIFSKKIVKLADDVKSWGYYINGTEPDVVSKCPYDLIVVDSRDGDGNAFTPNQVTYMKKYSKYLISYISLGEAESYRPYWKKEWSKKRPVWLGPENPEWKGNYSIKQFWHPDWWNITTQILDGVITAGFDGIYIDKIDVYNDLGGTDVLRDKMVEYIQKVSAYCKSKNDKFIVIAQNAEELANIPEYLAAVDGIGKESLFYSGELDKVQKLNLSSDINSSADCLNLFKEAGKLVLCVEYVNSPLWPSLKKKLVNLGYCPYNGPKLLDRLNLSS